jgi:hypothetical protein
MFEPDPGIGFKWPGFENLHIKNNNATINPITKNVIDKSVRY